MKHRHFPRYNDDADFTTNAPSYYEDLARKEKLIRLLAERIWGYEEILDDTLEEIQERFRAWDKNLEDFPDDVKVLLQKWLDDGTLDHIINDTIFNWKLDTSIFEQFRDSVTAQLQQTYVSVLYPPYPLKPATGDGVTDDTEHIQKIVDFARDNGLNVLFPPRTYIIRTIYFAPGMTVEGYGATIKRPDNHGNYHRLFSVPEVGPYMWGGDTDSDLLVFKGFTFDSNSQNQGPYQNWQLEHSHCLFLSADPSKKGRLVSHIEDCTFRNCTGDGISLYKNTNTTIVNCSAENCFRGGFVLAGGHSKLNVTNFTTSGDIDPTGIDIEVDGAGYNGSFRVEVSINGLLMYDGDFDVNILDNSTFIGNDIRSYKSPFFVAGADSTVKISNSVFHVGHFTNTYNNIYYPKNMTFDNCDFYAYKEDNQSAETFVPVHVFFDLANGSRTNQMLSFNNCNFKTIGSFLPTDRVIAIYVEGNNKAGNHLLINGGSIENKFTTGIMTAQGIEQLTVKNMRINSKIAFNLLSSTAFPMRATIDNVEIGNNVQTYIHFPDSPTSSLLTHKNVVMNNLQNTFTATYDLNFMKFFGGRVIYGTENPTIADTPGLVGDIYRVINPASGSPYEWLCVFAHKSKASWKLVKTIPT